MEENKTGTEAFHSPPKEKIFLIGGMGSGKTYWAQRVADLLKCDWLDLDQQIEKAAEMTIREIFATEGEDYFRAKERDALQQLVSLECLVVACGGGTPCFHDNMAWMNKNGITIWLQPHIDELVIRLKRGKHKRPLIAQVADEELKEFIQQKLKEREPFYSLAKYKLEGEEISLTTFTKLLNHA